MPKGYGNWLRIELWERFCIYMFKCTDANKNNGCGIGTEIRVHICRNPNVGQIKEKEEGENSKVDFY